ncbi:MAG: DUF58 domain-containing protein [Pseudomonadota bacterium]
MSLRAEAEALAGSLPRLRIGAALPSDAAHLGSAGRRRAGTGEHFWQYRQHRPEDDGQRIDWRRSARGDTLFVRETELETARTFLFWTDPHAGFRWRGESDRATKADYAGVLALAMAKLLSKEGERVGVLGGRKPGFGGKAFQRVADDLRALKGNFPGAPRSLSALLVFSDFYEPDAIWRARIEPLLGTCRQGILIMVTDPVEENFPFKGRVKLSRPGTEDERMLGRAELIEAEYKEKFEARKKEVEDFAGSIGWQHLWFSTGAPIQKAGGHLHQVLQHMESGE